MKKYKKYGIPIFLGIVLLFTLLSTTVGEYLLPLVQVCELKGGVLEKKYRTEGMLGLDIDRIKENKQVILAPVAGRLNSSKLKEQQEVKKGEVLFTITPEDEQDAIEKERLKGERESLQIKEKLLKQEENYLEKQLEQIKKQQKEKGNTLQAIQQQRLINKKEQEVIQKEELLKIGAISQDEYNQLQETLQIAKEKLESLKEEYIESYKEKTDELEFKISKLISERQDIKHQIAVKEKELQIKETKKTVVVAPMSGFMQELQITTGGRVEENMQIVTLIPKEVPYVLAFDIPIAQNQLIAIDNQVTFKIGYFKRQGIVIRKKLDQACENYKITCSVDLEDLETLRINPKEYQKVEVLVNNCTQNYDCIVPVSAIVTKQGKEFIYTVKEVETLLGKKQIVTEAPIKIIDDDNKQVAVEGELSLGTRVITEMSKSLKNGDRVRME